MNLESINKIYNYPTSYNGFDAEDYFHELVFGIGSKPVPTDYKCCLCGEPFNGYGNNPAPITYDKRLRCCNDCNVKYVIPARSANDFRY